MKIGKIKNIVGKEVFDVNGNTIGWIDKTWNSWYEEYPGYFFGIKTKVMKDVLLKNEKKFEKKGYKVLFDILKYCGKVRTAEVYYNFKERSYGSSKIGRKQILCYLKSLFR